MLSSLLQMLYDLYNTAQGEKPIIQATLVRAFRLWK